MRRPQQGLHQHGERWLVTDAGDGALALKATEQSERCVCRRVGGQRGRDLRLRPTCLGFQQHRGLQCSGVGAGEQEVDRWHERGEALCSGGKSVPAEDGQRAQRIIGPARVIALLGDRVTDEDDVHCLRRA